MSEFDHDPELYVAMIEGRDKRIRELEAERERFHTLYTAACRIVSAETDDHEREAIGWLHSALNELKAGWQALEGE